MNWAPALASEEIKADNAVGVDVRMQRYRAISQLDKDDFWGFCEGASGVSGRNSTRAYDAVGAAGQQRRTDGILRGELELQAINLALVNGVVIENSNVEEPFVEVVGRNEIDPGRKAVVQLRSEGRQAESVGMISRASFPVKKDLRACQGNERPTYLSQLFGQAL